MGDLSKKDGYIFMKVILRARGRAGKKRESWRQVVSGSVMWTNARLMNDKGV